MPLIIVGYPPRYIYLFNCLFIFLRWVCGMMQIRGFDELGGIDDFHEDTLAFVMRWEAKQDIPFFCFCFLLALMAVHAAVAKVQRALQFRQNNRRGARARWGGIVFCGKESARVVAGGSIDIDAGRPIVVVENSLQKLFLELGNGPCRGRSCVAADYRTVVA